MPPRLKFPVAMVLDPVQRRLAQFLQRRTQALRVLDAVEPFARKSLRKLPGREVYRFHSRTPAILAQKPWLPRRVIRRVSAKLRSARRTAVKAWQPPAQPHGPAVKITQRQSPIPRPFDLADRQQDQPEHRLGPFAVGQYPLRGPPHPAKPG